MIKNSFEYLDLDMLSKLFTTLVQQYGNATWGPLFTLDQRKAEKVQRRATHLLPSLHDKSYTERLSILSLPSLLYRHQKGDLIFLYKILNDYFSSDFTNLYTYSTTITTTTTREHQFKLFKQHSRLLCRTNYFMNRVIDDWNSLPTSVVESTSINTFKLLLDNYLLDFRFNFMYNVLMY